jgi:hypothetical protein
MVVGIDGNAAHLVAGDELRKLGGGFLAACPLLAGTCATLVPLGRVDSEQADFSVAERQGVAVD